MTDAKTAAAELQAKCLHNCFYLPGCEIILEKWLCDHDERIRNEAIEAALPLAAEQLIEAITKGSEFAVGSPLAKVKRVVERIQLEARLAALRWARETVFASAKGVTGLDGTYDISAKFMQAFPDRSYIVDADKWDAEIVQLKGALERVRQ